MPQRPPSAHSYLFTVRLWWEDLGDGQTEWRGVVRLVTSGEEHFFRDWETLGVLLGGMVSEVDEQRSRGNLFSTAVATTIDSVKE